jgi:hypothetical protein
MLLSLLTAIEEGTEREREKGRETIHVGRYCLSLILSMGSMNERREERQLCARSTLLYVYVSVDVCILLALQLRSSSEKPNRLRWRGNAHRRLLSGQTWDASAPTNFAVASFFPLVLMSLHVRQVPRRARVCLCARAECGADIRS